MDDEVAQAALARAIGVPFHAVRDAAQGQQVDRHGDVYRITPKGGHLMAYNPYARFDVHKHRHSALGGPVVYPRCDAMRDGDRCEYARHRGTHHAAQTGGHLWIEQHIGDCSACGQPVYPLGALVRQDPNGGVWFASLCCPNAVVIERDRLFDDVERDEPEGMEGSVGDAIDMLPPSVHSVVDVGVDPFGSSSRWGER